MSAREPAAATATATPDAERAVATALRRAGIYRLLGGAFAYPTRERIEELARAASTLAAMRPAGALGPALATFVRAASGTDAGDAGEEYVFLFDRQVRCPAYEGAWGGAIEMMGRVARLADIAGFYRAFGLEPAGAQPESEDHLVPELEFLSALALKEAWALDRGDGEHAAVTRDAARTFVTDHLGRWADAFAEAVSGATAFPYYDAAAALLARWIAEDIDALGAAPDRVGTRDGVDPVQADTFTCPLAPETIEEPPPA